MVVTAVWSEHAARVYRLLGRAYLRPPDRPYLESVAVWCTELLEQSSELPEEIRKALEALRASLSEPTEERTERLQEEYVRLFRGLSPRYSPPPPYESVYREGKLWGEATAAVHRVYRQWGLAPDEQALGREPPDHLGLELQFLGYLCTRAQDRGRTGTGEGDPLEAQQAFLEEHLDWVETLYEHVRAFDPDPFYEALLALTRTWLALHREHLQASNPKC